MGGWEGGGGEGIQHDRWYKFPVVGCWENGFPPHLAFNGDAFVPRFSAHLPLIIAHLEDAPEPGSNRGGGRDKMAVSPCVTHRDIHLRDISNDEGARPDICVISLFPQPSALTYDDTLSFVSALVTCLLLKDISKILVNYLLIILVKYL